jgi:tight adherence protein B
VTALPEAVGGPGRHVMRRAGGSTAVPTAPSAGRPRGRGAVGGWPRRGAARRLHRIQGGPARGWRRAAPAWLGRHRWPAATLAAASAALPGWLAGGPVAGSVAAGYAAVGVVALCRRWHARAEAAATVAALDAITTLAADLRAGLAPAGALAHALPAVTASTVDDVRRLGERLAAAWQVADVLGVRLADLLDRLDDDERGLRRVRVGAAAQAAGARATALLLAGLPVAGIALGYGMGTDPLHVLLRTAPGALCTGLAGAFQLTGLAWTARLARSVAEAG